MHRVGHLLPARVAEVPARGRRPHAPRLRAAVARDPARRLARAARQPSSGRRTPTTIPTARGAAWSASTGWWPPTTPRPSTWRVPPGSRSSGGGSIATSSAARSATRRRWPTPSPRCTPTSMRCPAIDVRLAAQQRALAMRHSDRWVQEGCDLRGRSWPRSARRSCAPTRRSCPRGPPLLSARRPRRNALVWSSPTSRLYASLPRCLHCARGSATTIRKLRPSSHPAR